MIDPDRAQLDDMRFLAGALGGAALATLALVGAYHAGVWLFGPLVWWHVPPVALVALGAGALGGGLLGLRRASR